MLILVLFVTLVTVPVLAVKGYGYRGGYLALAILAGVLGAVVMVLPTDIDPSTIDAHTLSGVKLIDEYQPFVGGWLLTVGLAALIGAAAFKPQRAKSAVTH